MQIRFDCTADSCVAIIEYEPLESLGGSINCPRCGKEHALKVSSSVREQDFVDECAVCGGREFFIRKDFPQRLGLLIVVIFGLAAIYFFDRSILVAWSILAAAVVLDVFIYMFVGKVTCCYACRAEYRQCQLNPVHADFDLATSEKY